MSDTQTEVKPVEPVVEVQDDQDFLSGKVACNLDDPECEACQ